jgi:cytochrome b involved in lipid metabolism
MSWGRGVSNEKLKYSQRLALQKDAAALVDTSAKKKMLQVLQFGSDGSVDVTLDDNALGNLGKQYGYISKEDAKELDLLDSINSGKVYIYVRTYPQVHQKIRIHQNVKKGVLVLSEMQRQNLEVTRQDSFEFTFVFDTSNISILSSVSIDVRPRYTNENEVKFGDAKVLTSLSTKCLFGLIVTKNERFLIVEEEEEEEADHQLQQKAEELSSKAYSCSNKGATEWILTVTDVDIDIDDWEDSITVPDVNCGKISSETTFFLKPEVEDCAAYTLTNVNRSKQNKKFTDIVEITCNDDEMFPVRKKILTPCIKLTSVVADGLGKYRGKAHNNDEKHSNTTAIAETTVKPVQARVDIDCLTFDRCLLYLESECRGHSESHDFEAQYNEDMLDAAIKLGCRGLEDLALKKMGAFASRVRSDYIRWEEVLQRNNEKKDTILVMDGMVYDVTRWLPEHPGGNTIIPKQALNKDSTKFFELYHSSRKSFQYLKEFYIGELHPSDLQRVPPASKGKPSDGFLQQLREFTTWRVTINNEHKSF